MLQGRVQGQWRVPQYIFSAGGIRNGNDVDNDGVSYSLTIVVILTFINQ